MALIECDVSQQMVDEMRLITKGQELRPAPLAYVAVLKCLIFHLLKEERLNYEAAVLRSVVITHCP